MNNRIYSFVIVFLLIFPRAFSQALTGRIYKKGSMEILPGINIRNSGTGKYNTSDLGGNYRVQASPGDSIIFSSAGYHPDTVIASNATINRGYDVYLVPNVVTLTAVEIDP